MVKYFYLSKKTLIRMGALSFLTAMFMAWWISLVSILIVLVWLFLFRKKQIDFTSKRGIRTNIILSPISGRVKKVTEHEDIKEVTVQIGLLDDYGLYMPFYGEVKSFLKNAGWNELEFISQSVPFVRIAFQDKNVSARIFTDSGDKASAAAYLGYFPLGALLQIRLPKNAEVLVRSGDLLQSSQTIIASI